MSEQTVSSSTQSSPADDSSLSALTNGSNTANTRSNAVLSRPTSLSSPMLGSRSASPRSADWLSYRLPADFLESQRLRPVSWGFPIGAGNTLGELTFFTLYSRARDNGTKERWWEVCQRVTEGTYSILKDWCIAARTPWNESKAHRSAAEFYERLFTFKWTPPGRGLWGMGTEFVNGRGDSASLQNCSFISTATIRDNPTFPFVRLMEQQMLGIGVGFDTVGAGQVVLHEPDTSWEHEFVIPDTREGWCESLDLLLLSYFAPRQPVRRFDYSRVRPAGTPIKGFGGIAAGPASLEDLHARLRRLLGGRRGQLITSTDIVDIMNCVGKCVVAANVRSSAELALGSADDVAFLNLKNPAVNPERCGPDGWGYTSNNSVVGTVGMDYRDLADLIAINGEPGIVWLDHGRAYGRLGDPRNDLDYLVSGCNPCSEQLLEDGELCTLSETYPANHSSTDDYLRTIKFAFMYGKAVTLLSTKWPESNEVMQRNRRIGLSMSGIAQYVERWGWTRLRRLQDEAYAEVTRRDVQYSRWLGVRESIKKTTVKPSGTVSLLVGATPGVHWPVASSRYLRRKREAVNAPYLDAMRAAGYHVEPSYSNPDQNVVVTYPTQGPAMRSEREVPMWEKMHLAATCQQWWSDNAVSVTVSFLPEERNQIGPALQAFDGGLKTCSFLPLDVNAYPQMPYESVADDAWQAMRDGVTPIDWERLYDSGEAADGAGERGCTNDSCEVPQ